MTRKKRLKEMRTRLLFNVAACATLLSIGLLASNHQQATNDPETGSPQNTEIALKAPTPKAVDPITTASIPAIAFGEIDGDIFADKPTQSIKKASIEHKPDFTAVKDMFKHNATPRKWNVSLQSPQYTPQGSTTPLLVANYRF